MYRNTVVATNNINLLSCKDLSFIMVKLGYGFFHFYRDNKKIISSKGSTPCQERGALQPVYLIQPSLPPERYQCIYIQ